jgi:O-ureido-D-serine cyclo-ligase
MPHIALATAIAATGHDDDLAPLLQACAAAGVDATARAWDDPSVGWSRFDAVVVRSTWDYTQRLAEFRDWCARVAAVTRLVNPLPVIQWNSDKHYLADLAGRGVPVVSTRFVELDHEPLPALQGFLAEHPRAAEFVVKPSVGAGSRDAKRYSRAQEFAAANHIARLLDAGHGVMLQPYLTSVDRDGETGLILFNGAFSHAIRKGPLLAADADATSGLFATEAIAPRVPDAGELNLAHLALEAMQRSLDLSDPPTYARVDLIRDDAGEPQLLELELCEPSLFLNCAKGSAERFADILRQLLSGPDSGT